MSKLEWQHHHPHFPKMAACLTLLQNGSDRNGGQANKLMLLLLIHGVLSSVRSRRPVPTLWPQVGGAPSTNVKLLATQANNAIHPYTLHTHTGSVFGVVYLQDIILLFNTNISKVENTYKNGLPYIKITSMSRSQHYIQKIDLETFKHEQCGA